MSALRHLLPNGALTRLDGTPFLTRCRAGKISRAELELFLVQHHLYAKHFTRYLCALLSNLENDGDRLALTENLFEEMGLGPMGDEPHSKIYRDMLRALGLNAHVSPHVETEDLVNCMMRLCSSADPMVGLAALCLGAEAIVPHIYSQILFGLRSQGFPEEHLRFFPLHIEGDDQHALTMAEIMERELVLDPSRLGKLQEVASMIIEKRARFFESLTLVKQELETTYAV